MKKFQNSIEIDALLQIIQGDLILKSNTKLDNVAELSEANAKSICFVNDLKFLEIAKLSKAGLILVKNDFNEINLPNTNLLKVDNPYFSFMTIVKFLLDLEKKNKIPFISSNATIASSAKISKNVTIETNVVVEENVIIGEGTTIKSNSVIMKNSKIGKNTFIYPNTTIYNDCEIGNNVIIHSGVVIGADGFGYLTLKGKQVKIPQIGNVIIKDKVEIGANSTIDRAAIGSTIISEGTKIDNLVQIGHNCIVGNDTVICAQTGLAGSTIVGNQVFLAGQVGVAGHLKIGDRSLVGAQSGITGSIPPDSKMWGTPAINATTSKKMFIVQKQMLDLIKPIKKIIKNQK
jgi:UDP-3-O-[3-hydroxymyristoyl] glucosamine N-acyltransferase